MNIPRFVSTTEGSMTEELETKELDLVVPREEDIGDIDEGFPDDREDWEGQHLSAIR